LRSSQRSENRVLCGPGGVRDFAPADNTDPSLDQRVDLLRASGGDVHHNGDVQVRAEQGDEGRDLLQRLPRPALIPGTLSYTWSMSQPEEIEFVFEPQEEGGYYVYAPDLPGLHTQGDSLEEATANAAEALALYVEGAREEGRPIGVGVIRRTLAIRA
jgi:predicted RNase H-like HicB family nuclease